MISSGLIKSIQNEMRKDGGVDGDAQRLSQLVWLIFLKALDDSERQREFIDGNYQPAIPEQYRWRNWASREDGITGDALLEFINNSLIKDLKELPSNPSNPLTGIVHSVFEESFNYMKNGTQLRKVINRINEIDFNSSDDRHTFGDIYETLLASLQSAGNAGEFYTPRAVTKFIVDRVDPRLGEKVYDPAAGTGGFLTGAIDHIRKSVKTPEDEQILQNSIFGTEWKQLPYSLLITNLIFHGIEQPTNIKHQDTLARPLVDYGPNDRVDVIVANPPFGGSVQDGVEKNFPSSFRTKETADLFLVLFIRLLKNGGRAGIVLPDGFLFGDGVKNRIKEHLLEECNLHTIIRLPGSVFAPYTSISTNLLFFDKGAPTKDIWYYEHRLPEGVKAYNKTKPIRFEEFAPISEWWNNRQESEVAWKVSIDEIKKRGYNLDIKNPNVVELNETNPEEILTQYRVKWREISEIADRLQLQLKEVPRYFSSQKIAFLTENLHEYLHVPHATKHLRKTILHLAVSGQLVPQNPSEGTGAELYEQIQAEKTELIKQGKLRKSKPLPEITDDEIPFDIPKNWKWVRLPDIYNSITPASKVKTSEMLQSGNIPVVDQGQTYIAGYVNSGDVTTIDSPVVIFGDHTREIKLIDFDFIAGADGVKILEPILVDSDYFYTLVDVFRPQSRGYGRHFKMLNDKIVPLPPLAEQKRIVAKTTQLLDLVDELEKRLEN